MNSLSKENINQNNVSFQKHTTVPSGIIIRCNEGSLGNTSFDFTTGPGTQNVNQPIVSVTIDIPSIQCSRILIDFTGILNTTATGTPSTVDTTFNFILFRNCKGSKVRQPLRAFGYTHSFTGLGGSNIDSRTLEFEYFSCADKCEDCCTYIVELASVTSNINNIINTFDVSINGALCAMAIDSSC